MFYENIRRKNGKLQLQFYCKKARVNEKGNWKFEFRFLISQENGLH